MGGKRIDELVQLDGNYVEQDDLILIGREGNLYKGTVKLLLTLYNNNKINLYKSSTESGILDSYPSENNHQYRFLSDTGKGIVLAENLGYEPAYFDGTNTNKLVSLKESYIDENGNWYRWYFDGWLEQGGIATEPYYSTVNQVTYLKPFKDVNYTLIVSLSREGNYGTSDMSVYNQSFNKTATGFQNYTHQASPKNWYACGISA
jgi:hypothetical protein